MEKSFPLERNETAQLTQLDQARTQALAMIGALKMDLKKAKRQWESTQEQQRAFIRQALLSRGVDRYENARATPDALIVTLPEEPAPVLPSPAMTKDRVNGPIDTMKE